MAFQGQGCQIHVWDSVAWGYVSDVTKIVQKYLQSKFEIFWRDEIW